MHTETATTVLPNESPVSDQNPVNAAPPSDLVSANVEDLIVGRVLRYPIVDSVGTLLLAEGMTLTSEFKQNLDMRRIESVQLHSDDYTRLTFQKEISEEEHLLKIDASLAKNLDEIIDSGILFVVNSEPAILNQMANHGCKNYHREKFIDRINRNKDTSIFIDNLMHNALQGKKINCGDVMRLTANYLNDITTDVDCTLTSKIDMICHNQISDHCVGMAILGMAMGVELGMDAQNVRTIALAGLVNEWGMVRVPQEIRTATRRLTEDDFYEIRKHPIYTLRILDQMCGVSAPVPLICYQVHERPNGQGYPQGRTGERIHIAAKILAVADAYNALIAPRPYRPPLTPYAAMECILRQTAAGDFDINATRALLMIQSLFPIGSYVVLDNGSVARVLRRNGDKFTQPIVKILQDSEGKNVPDDSDESVIDLNAAGLEVVKAIPAPGSNAISFNHEILRLGQRYINDPESDEDKSSALLQMLSVKPDPSKKASPTTLISVEQYTPKQKHLASNAIRLLDSTQKIVDNKYSAKRQYSRTKLRTIVNIHILDLQNQLSNLQPGCTFRVMTNDVSQGGISFIYPDIIDADNIMVQLTCSENENAWFLGNIVNRREIGDTSFWLHSVAFQRRVSM